MKIRKTHAPGRTACSHSIEPLEARIAPALIVDLTGNITVSESSTTADDNLAVSIVGANFHFTNPGGLIAGNGAAQIDAFTVEVPTGGFNGALNIDTGLGNDAVTLFAGLGALTGLSIKAMAINPGQPLPALNIGPGNLVLTATNFPLSIGGAVVVTGGGSILIDAPGLGLAPGSVLSTDTGGSVLITTDSIPIEPTAKIQTDANGFVSITAKSPGMTFDLGGRESATVIALDNTEIGAIVTGGIRITNETGPVNITAPITLATQTNFDIAAGQNDISFNGAGALDTAGGALSLTAPNGGIFGGSAQTDAIAGLLTLKAGQGGIGTKTNPLFIDATLLDDTSISNAVKQFINAVKSVGLVKLNAAGAFVTLSGGPYVAMATDIMGEVLLKINGTLDLNGHDEIVSSLKGSGTVTNSNAATPSNLDFSSDADGSFSGALTGNLTILKDGPAGQRLTGTNTFTGDITINSGILQIDSDAALGDPANAVIINDGALSTIGTFTIARNITAGAVGGTPTIDVASGTLTATGTISGNLHKTGSGQLVFGSGFTGKAPIAPNSGTTIIAGTKVTTTGSGDVILTVVSDGMGGTRISAIELQNTKANSVLNIQSPTPITIDKIVSLDPADPIGAIKLGPTVTLGDGVNDTVADLDIRGSVKKLLFNDISPFAHFEIGKGLAYLDTYQNHPNLTLHNVLGAGVSIDVAGDGMTPAGIGGGGLGKVVVNQWSDPGLIETTQSVGSFKVKNGDCFVVLQLDPNHLGAATTASIGKMAIINGAWGSSGTVIEGSVGSFSASEFLAAADITAASMRKLLVKKGSYSGTTTLTDPAGKALSTFSVNGDYLGFVNASEGISNISIKGDFKGSLSAQFIGSISAYSFDGTGTNPGDRDQIVSTGGSLGTLKTSVRGIKNFEIHVNTVFDGFGITWRSAPTGAVGVENVTVAAGQINHVDVTMTPNTTGATLTGIRNSVFESAAGIGEVTSSNTVSGSTFAATTNVGNVLIKGDLTSSKLLAGTSLGGDGVLGGVADQFTPGGTIGNVTVLGMFATTTIAAGVDPGAGFIYGDGDTVGTDPAVAGPGKIGALVFGALSGTVGSSSGMAHTDAIEAAAIKSLKVGTGTTIKDFTTARYLDTAGDGEGLVDVLVKLI